MARNVQHDLPEYFQYKINMSHAFSGAEISCFATYYANQAIFMRVWAVRSRLAIAACIKQSISMARNVQHDLPEYVQYKNNMSHAFSGAEISCFTTYYANLDIFLWVWAVRSRLAIVTCHQQSISMAKNVQHDLPEYFQYKNNMPHAFSGAEISCFATNDVNLAIFMRVWAVRSRLAIAKCH